MSDHIGRSYAAEIESFRELAGDSDTERLDAFISQVNSGSEDGVSPIVLSPDSDKAHRTVSISVSNNLCVHLAVRRSFGCCTSKRNC